MVNFADFGFSVLRIVGGLGLKNGFESSIYSGGSDRRRFL